MEKRQIAMDNPIGLTPEGCRARTKELRERMREANLDALLVCDRRHVNYLTGYWTPAIFNSVVLVERDGPTTLVAPPGPLGDAATAAVRLSFEAQKLATLIDDQLGEALAQIARPLASVGRLGVDGPFGPPQTGAREWVDARPILWAMKRFKHDDEVALLRRAIVATEAAYAYAKHTLVPGVTEIDLCAGMLAEATRASGEIIGEIGNDFQVGSPGGSPRRRAAQAGEIAVFDIGVTIQGYRGDMCRSFVVGGEPTPAQQEAHERVVAALTYVEKTAAPGVSCASLFHDVVNQLKNDRGWSFPHHLGHGIGINPHEAPRLNPYWDDTFAVGDLFVSEPALYADELRAGLRIENAFVMRETGAEKLTTFPTDLV